MPGRVADAICSIPWAIREESLAAIIAIANRENELTPEAVQALIGRPLENTHTVTVRDGVATIPIEGPIVRYASLFTAISGGTSIEVIMQDLRSSLASELVSSIILAIDSPGGEVNGTAELADYIYGNRGVKPITAYVSHQGCSAAYWIASATDRIVVSPTSIVGSIGVAAAVPKPDPEEKKRVVEFVSSQSPKKRPNVDTKEGRGQVQEMVDAIADVFVSRVARNRGVSIDTVLEDFGGGGIFVGQNSVDAGLVDSVGSYEEVHAFNAREEETEMPDTQTQASRWERLMAYLSGEDTSASADSTASPTSHDHNVGATDLQPIQGQVVVDDRLRTLEADNRRLRMERYIAEGTLFADQHINDQRAFPSERERIIAMFVQASLDDLTLGAVDDGGNTRIKMLGLMFGARPAHQLTMESLTPALAQVLKRQGEPPAAEAGGKPLSQAQLDEMLSKTTLGAQVLKERNGLVPAGHSS